MSNNSASKKNNSAKVYYSNSLTNGTGLTTTSTSTSASGTYYTITNPAYSTISNVTSCWGLTDIGYNKERIYRLILELYNEEEIDKFLEILNSKIIELDDRETYKDVLNKIFFNSERVFSEDFIMKYIQYLDLDEVKKKYKVYIKSAQ